MKKASYDNLTYYTDDDIFIWHINNGRSEPYVRELDIVKFYLHAHPSRNNTFIDVGAHIGTTSLPYSRLYKHVLGFEPNSQSYDLFLKNIEENSVTNITPFNKGVFNKTMNCKVVRHGENSGCYYIKECDQNETDSIEVIRLDDMHIMEQVDFLKIDTEGSELQVLEGAVELIKKNRPLIQVETNYCSTWYFGYDQTSIYKFMEDLEYNILHNDGHNPIFYFEK